MEITLFSCELLPFRPGFGPGAPPEPPLLASLGGLAVRLPSDYTKNRTRWILFLPHGPGGSRTRVRKPFR